MSEGQKDLTQRWWEERGYRGVYEILSDTLNDDDALFWVTRLLTAGSGPYTPEDLEVVFRDTVTDGGSRAFAKLCALGLLVETPDTAFVWSDEIKKEVLAVSSVPVLDSW